MKCFGDKTRVHHCKVVLLDEQELLQEIQDTTTGQDLLDVVFKHLNLMETAYFGLRYLDPNNQTHWLDPVKKVSKQLKGTSPFTLYFSVKFYAADPCKLVEEITRYQFFLQVKQDILQGRLPVAEDLAAELGAYAVQSELGDYDPRRHCPGYVSEFRFLTTQSPQLEHKIADLHKKLIGQVPSKAENCYLEKVKWLDMYGVDLHPVLGEDNIEYFLGLTPAGVIVLRNKAKVGNYFWPRISKVYFRGRFFMLRVRDKNNSENTYGFETPSKAACKHLWQCCVEHHAFFRLTQATGTTPQAIFSLGSQFRYSGRTEKEILLDASQKGRDEPEFSRVPSRRFQRRIVEGAADTPRIEDGELKPETRNTVSLGPTPISTSAHMYRSNSLTLAPRSDSPRSTRSAPYPRVGDSSGDRATLLSPNRRRGESPHSTRSTPANTKDHRISRRTSSVDSQSSVESRGHRRHSHRRSRGRSSDGEGSEASSKGSSRGHRRHRHRHHSDDSDQHGHRRHRRRKKDRSTSGTRLMVDSSEQWMAVQAQQYARGHAATVKDISHKSGYTPSGHDTEADSHHHNSNKRRHKKHRSRSRSPSEEKKNRIPESIRKHLDFGLQTPSGMTEAELKEIPYTKIETAKNVKIKYSDSKGRSKHKSPRRSKSNTSDKHNKDNPPADGESPPPPYTPLQSKNGSKSNHKAGVEEGGGRQSSPDEERMVNGYHHPPSPTRSALVKTPDQELGDSIYRATPTHLTNGNHSYGYTNSSHKPVMVNGPSVKALVTNSVGSSPSFNHDSPSPPPFRDDGSNSSFVSGSGFATPNMMKNGSNDRNSHFTAVLKPHPSPQSSVTSGISLGSSSVSISAESNESTMNSGSNTQSTTNTQLSSTSNSPDPDSHMNNDHDTTNDSSEPYYSNLSQYQNNLLYNQDIYQNISQRKKDTEDKQTLYPSLDQLTQHSTNILIHYHETENTNSQPSSLSTSTPRPRPRSSIISTLRGNDTSTHIVQSYGPSPSPTNCQTDTNSLQRSGYTSTLPRPSSVTSPNAVGVPLSSSVPSSNSGFESSTLPRPSSSLKPPMRTTGSQTNILRTTGCQTNPTNKGQKTSNTHETPMGPEASTSSPSPNSTNLAHSALHWKVYNWDAYREQTEWSNSLGRNVKVQTPTVNQTSTAVTGELGIPYEYVPASSGGSPGGSGTDSSPVPPPRPPYPSEFAHSNGHHISERGTSPSRRNSNGYVSGSSNGNWKDVHSNGHANKAYMNGINGVTIGHMNSQNSSEKFSTLNNKHKRHNGYTYGNNNLKGSNAKLDIESRNNKNVSFSLADKSSRNSSNKGMNGSNIINIHHDDIKQVEISAVNMVEGKREVKGKVADEISTNL